MQKEELDTLVGDEFDEIVDENLDGKSEDIDEDIIDDEIIDENSDDGEIIDENVEDNETIDETSDDGEIIDESSDDGEIVEDDIDGVEGFEDVLSNADEEENNEDEDVIAPPPADNKHKVVAQLDEVTKESEEKATQILDIMDEISANVDKNINSLKEILEFLTNHKNICEKLHTKFPHIKTFEKEFNEMNEMIKKIEEIIDRNEYTSEKIFTAMDIMQYQDIHRQKIERVINIMRALIKYMNKLFEGSVEDEKRVQSARHIHGDESAEVLSDEDIEALLDQFGV